MQMKSRWRRQITWLLSCAIVFASIAPAIAQQIASATGVTLAEICSVSGPRRVALDNTQSSSVPADDHASKQQCPFCRLHSQLPALPTSAFGPIVFTALERVAPKAPDTRLHRTKPAWVPSLSRAPPAFS